MIGIKPSVTGIAAAIIAPAADTGRASIIAEEQLPIVRKETNNKEPKQLGFFLYRFY